MSKLQELEQQKKELLVLENQAYDTYKAKKYEQDEKASMWLALVHRREALDRLIDKEKMREEVLAEVKAAWPGDEQIPHTIPTSELTEKAEFNAEQAAHTFGI